MNKKIISLQTQETIQFSNKISKQSKTRRIARAIGWAICMVPSAVIGFSLGGVFGIAFGLFAGFLFAQILDPLLTKKFA